MLILDECRLGVDSQRELATCTPNLQRLFRFVIRVLPRHLDLRILCGFRGEAAQNQALKDGTSTLPWPKGKHNRLPSRALDFRPHPFVNADWTDSVRFGRILGFIECASIELAIPVRLGCDWDNDGSSIDEKLRDLGHVEDLAA